MRKYVWRLRFDVENDKSCMSLDKLGMLVLKYTIVMHDFWSLYQQQNHEELGRLRFRVLGLDPCRYKGEIPPYSIRV